MGAKDQEVSQGEWARQPWERDSSSTPHHKHRC